MIKYWSCFIPKLEKISGLSGEQRLDFAQVKMFEAVLVTVLTLKRVLK